MKLQNQLRTMVGLALLAILVPVGSLARLAYHVGGLHEAAEYARRELSAKLELTTRIDDYFREQLDRDSRRAPELAVAAEITSRAEILKMFAEIVRLSSAEHSAAPDQAELDGLEGLRRQFVELADEANAGNASAEPSEALARTDRRFDTEFKPALFEAVSRESGVLARLIAELERESTSAGVMAGLSLVLGLVGLLTLVRRLAGRVERALAELLGATRSLATGDLDTRVGTLKIAEFDEIGTAFNFMGGELQEATRSKVRVEKLAAVGELAASVGHEIRNPLGAARNALAYLRKRHAQSVDQAKDARVGHFIDLADRELATCNTIVQDLLDFARERPLNVTACTLEPVLREVLEVIRPREDVAIALEIEPQFPPVDADRDQLRQLLINLVQNAIEAIPAGRPGHVQILGRVLERGLALSVRDDGTGIPEADRVRIFEPLVTTKTRGTGLGLAITSGIIKRHGWTLELETELNKGTTFHVHLPLRERKVA